MKQKLSVKQKLQQKHSLHGRLEAVRWIGLTESEVGSEVRKAETDPLFQELLYGGGGALRRKRWPAGGLHAGFYELDFERHQGQGSADISDLVEKKEDLLKLIRRIGQAAFERFFLYSEDGRPLKEVCEELDLSEAEGRRILDLVLDVGMRSEFFTPGAAPEAAATAFQRIARIEQDPREREHLYFMFTSTHWARGRYEISYDKLEEWKKIRVLDARERKRLTALLRSLELLNMRQDTMFQILSRVTEEQSAFLRTRVESRRRPLSLRELARRIGVAPSTVSRAVGTRSVELPWGEELPLKSLLSGTRTVVLSILEKWREAGELGRGVSDNSLVKRLADECGIALSRRTLNDCRRALKVLP